MKSFVTSPMAAFIVICSVFGTTFAAIKIGIDAGWPPLLAAGIRFTLAGAMIALIAAARGERLRFSTDAMRELLLIGLTVTGINFTAFYTSEVTLSTGVTALIAGVGPLFAFALALVRGERSLTASAGFGLACGTIGLACITLTGGIAHTHASLLAAAAIVGGEICYVWGLSRTRRALQYMSTMMLSGAQQFVGGIALLAGSLCFEHRGIAHFDTSGVVALLYLIVIASIVAQSLALWLAGVTDATFASSWCYVSPFIALLLGAAVFREQIHPAALFGGALVVFGAYSLNRRVTHRVSLRRVEAVRSPT